MKMLISHEFHDNAEAKAFLDHMAKFGLDTPRRSAIISEPALEDAPPPHTPTPKTEEPEKPKKRRGRPHGSKAKPKEEPATDNATKPTEAAPKGRRGRTKPAPEKETAATPGDIPITPQEITDADVVKAASEAAEALDVQPVMDILESYEVEVDGKKVVPEKVNQLNQEQRVDFLARLRDLQNPEGEKAW